MGPSADIRVIGLGGAGGNAVRHMIAARLSGVAIAAANTDAQALAACPALWQCRLGARTARGLGAGGKPSVGLSAARESTPELEAMVRGADLVFVAAGLGGGTGTGSAPWVAHLARAAGALVVGVVTTPFAFEGKRRASVAAQGLDALAEQVDSLVVIENDRLCAEQDEPSLADAFHRADRVLGEAVRGISDLVMRPGLVNLDFADVRAVLRGGGRALMGTGKGVGPERASHAVAEALRSPLLRSGSIEGARGALLQFTVDPKLGLGRIHEAALRVQSVVDDDAEILFGVVVDPALKDEVHVTLVAAGLGAVTPAAEPEPLVRSAELALAPAVTRRRNALTFL